MEASARRASPRERLYRRQRRDRHVRRRFAARRRGRRRICAAQLEEVVPTMPTSRSSRPKHTTPTARSRRCAKRSSIPKSASSSRPKTAWGMKSDWRRTFGAENVVAAALTTPIDRDRDGNARPAKEGGLGLAPVGSNAYNWLAATFAGTGLTVKVVEDWRALKWSKLALNVGRQRQLRDPQRLAKPLRALREDLHARDSHDPRGSCGDAGARRRADRFAALPGPRALPSCRPTESALPHALDAEHRGGTRNETAIIAARSAARSTADRSRCAQRCRRLGRARATAFRPRSMRCTRGCLTTSRTRRRFGRNIASIRIGWRPKSKPR